MLGGALYFPALLGKLALIALATRYFFPARLSAEGWHCYRLLAPPGVVARWRFRQQAAGRGPWLASAAIFFLTGTELERSAIFPAFSWPVPLCALGAAALALPIAVLLLTGAVAPFYARRNGC